MGPKAVDAWLVDRWGLCSPGRVGRRLGGGRGRLDRQRQPPGGITNWGAGGANDSDRDPDRRRQPHRSVANRHTYAGAAVDASALPDRPRLPIDVFGMVTLEDDRTFQYAFDLSGHACSKSEGKKPTPRKLDELKATRIQSHMAYFYDFGQAEVEFLGKFARAGAHTDLYDSEIGHLGESEKWGFECDKAMPRELFGGEDAFMPPVARQFRTLGGADGDLTSFVGNDPAVATETEKRQTCTKASIRGNIADDHRITETFQEYRQDNTFVRSWLPEALACKRQTNLDKAVRAAQWAWLKKHPEALTVWEGDQVYYRSKLPAAQAMIKRLQ